MMAPASWALTGFWRRAKPDFQAADVWKISWSHHSRFMTACLVVPFPRMRLFVRHSAPYCHTYMPRLKKEIFVWEEVDANAGLIEVTVQSCSCYDLFVVMSNSQREGIREVQALSKNLVMFTFLCAWAQNDGSYSSQRSPRAHPTGQ